MIPFKQHGDTLVFEVPYYVFTMASDKTLFPVCVCAVVDWPSGAPAVFSNICQPFS